MANTIIPSEEGGVLRVHITFVAYGAGNFDDALVSNISGFLTNVYVKPGTPTPTTATGLTVEMNGIDLLGGAGAGIVTAANALITPEDTAGNLIFPGFLPELTVKLSGNLVDSAVAEVFLLIQKAR